MLSNLLFLGIIFYAKKTNLGRCQSMTITDKAAEKAKAILADEGKANWGIRIYVAGESCCGPSFGLNLQEVQMPEDEIVEKDGIKIFMDKETSKSLDGRELDFYTGEEGEGFIFTGGVSSCSPGGSCGSGSSGCSSCG
jgi:iron-sulfur cluster insertion protein